jgi:hypothetical protein
MTRTIVRRTELDQLFLGIPDRQEEVSLVRWPGRVVLNAGRDSNGNGTADAVVVLERGKALSWRFLFDPFTSQGSFQRVLFGRLGDIPFLFRARGASDALAVIVRNHITYRGLKSSLKRKIRLSDYFPAKPPRTLRGSDGRDTLLFVSENSEGVLVTTFKGRTRTQVQFNVPGTLFIGDFTGSGEVTYGILQSNGELTLASGETFEGVEAGEPVSEGFQKSYQPEDVSATPFPELAVTIITTISVGGTEVPGLPMNTITPIPSPTPLSGPTSTSASTSTPTAIATSTSTPLPTPDNSQYIIFVTSASFGANLGGIRGGDETCQGLGAAAGLSGSFLSVLSDSTNNAASRFTINAPIYNSRGEVVANNGAALWNGALGTAVRYDEYGNIVTG